MWKQAMMVALAKALMLAGLQAQQVAYSPYFRDYSLSLFQVAGKAGDYYWVEKQRPLAPARVAAGIRQVFEVYDSRMNAVQKVSGEPMPEATVKEYLVAGNEFFDQLILLGGGQQTRLLLKRFTADGLSDYPPRIIDSLPIAEPGTSFILMRSADRSKLELIAFESRPAGATRLHAFLFDQNWNILHKSTADDPAIAQPCIQDDFISFPAEDFDNLPVKLADNGEWVMSAVSRISTGFLFFHFCSDGQFSYRQIRLASSFSMQDIALTIDNKNAGASVGILSGFRRTAIKQLQVSHYSMAEGRFDFDSAYRFHTLAGTAKNKNLTNESLMGLPGGGYLFFKEYGRENSYDWDNTDPDNWDAALLPDGAADAEPLLKPMRSEGFARRSGLQPLQPEFSRGDLAMFYFPGSSGDSTWSGLIHSPKTTEFNWPALSYLVMPAAGRLLFVYNSIAGMSNYASTTVVDRQGNPAAGGNLVFWKFNRELNFQHAHRIAAQEVAVPYTSRPGFAVIRL